MGWVVLTKLIIKRLVGWAIVCVYMYTRSWIPEVGCCFVTSSRPDINSYHELHQTQCDSLWKLEFENKRFFF
jgi:hypothetical protein